jgi:hypothetical protein
MGFLWYCEYSMASVFASVYSLASGCGCFDRAISEFKEYKKVKDSFQFESSAGIRDQLTCQSLYHRSVCSDVAILYQLMIE